MLFNSFIFFLFLGIVLPVFYLLKTKSSRNLFLLIVSYVFYGYWDWRFCSLLLATTILDFYIGKSINSALDDKKRKILLRISLFINLGILGFFKYFNFFADSLYQVGKKVGVNVDSLHLNILLPIGLSFYIFHNISYIVDIYHKKIKPTANLVDFGLFVAFFPQLVAGPIGRASKLMPQFEKKLGASKNQIKEGIVLMIGGLFRKVIIGDTTGRFVDQIFSEPEAYKSVEICCVLILFAIQIYADFSGYSHIARGCSKLFGVELMKNFEQPYLSRNITEFWRRWHISLSTWLRDYLYIPLGGNRNGKIKTYINLFITMLLGGLWHGASWNFVIWGALHGVYLAIHKLMTNENQPSSPKILSLTIKDIISILFTNILVLFAWLFFRSTNWETTTVLLSKIFNWESSEYTFWFIKTTGCFVLITLLIDILEYKSGKHTYMLDIKPVAFRLGLMISILVLTLCYMYQTKPAPFMYFQF